MKAHRGWGRRAVSCFAVAPLLTLVLAGQAAAEPCPPYPPSQQPCASPGPSRDPGGGGNNGGGNNGGGNNGGGNNGGGNNGGGQERGELRLSVAVVLPGQTVRVFSDGWAPNASIRLELHSSPRLLGAYLAGLSGAWSAAVTIPVETEPGPHEFVAAGTGFDGKFQTLRTPFQVRAAPAGPVGAAPGDGGVPAVKPPSALPRTGIWVGLLGVAGLSLVASGAAALWARRQRQGAKA